MFIDSRGDLLNVSASVGSLNIQSLVLAEFNLNDLSKIEKIGTYRYRPYTVSSPYYTIQSSYDSTDAADDYTDADISYSEYSGTDNGETFNVRDKTKDAYYSLGDCFLPFRPRSGINKTVYFGDQSRYIDNVRSGSRPRYYMPSKTDYFKYWTSYKKEGAAEYGISSPLPSSGTSYYGIDDACPFVVYNTDLNVNRIVIKMQTNVGDINLGLIRDNFNNIIADPLYDYSNATVPIDWKIQYLDQNNIWQDAISFNQISQRRDSSPVVGKDGHVEIFYGVKPPSGYEDVFELIGYVSSSTMLPNTGILRGYSYVVGATLSEQGTLYIYNGSSWITQTLEYGFSLYQEDLIQKNGVITKPVDPYYYVSGSNTVYREFIRIRGIRVVAQTMNKNNCTLDLIEMSPRLVVDMSGFTESFSITKTLANSTDTFLPVGSLAVSNGDIVLFNDNDMLTENNIFNEFTKTGSIITEYANQNVKFSIYETILNINGYDKFIPIKTLYADSFPRPYGTDTSISISLRDLFFRLETTNAPSVLSQKTTLTSAVATLLDYIGFSNYVFKNITNKTDPILEFFFVEPGISVAEILERLAVATQTAMFFDEYNNFVVMSKEFLLPSEGDITNGESSNRPVNTTLYGNTVVTNTTLTLPNIENIEQQEIKVINDGEIEYSIRYIQKDISSLKSSLYLNQERAYVYKPVLLWEVGQTAQSRSANGEVATGSGYALAAAPLNASLSASAPYVSSNQVVNNIIDLGEGVYWLSRFQGYLYANGEIIRYDAVEYAIPGLDSLIWITNNNEYQKYFATVPFNGKMYPTGRIRIYAEPYYESDGQTLTNGAVRIHGRGQFDTEIVEHSSGLSSYWQSANNVYGLRMKSEYIFSTTPTEDITVPTVGSTPRVELADVNTLARKSKRNGIIKNFMSSKVFADGYVNSLKTTESGTIQSSALVFRGPLPQSTVSATAGVDAGYGVSTTLSFPNHRDLVSYIYKDLSGKFSFRNFGTRIRIIGKIDNAKRQVANGSSDYYAITADSTADQATINGGSAGMGIMVDPSNGSGYYFEIVGLSTENIEKYYKYDENNDESQVVHDIVFYKVYSNTQSGENVNSPAIVKKLWGGLGNILVDSGIFAGQDRISKDADSTVYDLSVQYEVLGNNKGIRFYLYINNNLIQVVDDIEATISTGSNIKSSMALFVRGGTEAMFENIYALDNTLLKDSNTKIEANPNVFDDNGITKNEFLRKYALSGMLQSTYLSNITIDSPNTYKVYFEEFGTIMREADYFKVVYDQAYPAFIAKIAKTFTNDRSYVISGFYGGAYEAEFLIFNTADRTITLDETTGSYLRILGVTFTQNTTQKVTVDDYFNRISNYSDPQFSAGDIISPVNSLRQFNDIKASRAKYGNQKFTLSSMYIQSIDEANSMMAWIIDKIMRPRKILSISVYPMPYLQIGDIVNIDYVLESGIRYVDSDKKFVITEINYSRSEGSIGNTLSLVEI